MTQMIRIRMSRNGNLLVLDGNVAIMTDRRTPEEIVSQLRSMISQARSQYNVDFQFDLVEAVAPLEATDEEMALINRLRATSTTITPEELHTLDCLRAGSAKLVAASKPAKKAPVKASKPPKPVKKAKAAPSKGKKQKGLALDE